MEEKRLTLPIAMPDGIIVAPAVLERVRVDGPDMRVRLTVDIFGRTVRAKANTTEEALQKLASTLPSSWEDPFLPDLSPRSFLPHRRL